ncbi:TetR/AcrR family transcriptional regulator [Agromyces intestinalis]|uniref:TetR/AcrR family transcriptional regulator n=1 Tax=Agromyces intestinalis TaxID=2592652 RepID=A0A5C1YGV1_9MICO|nr:TetR/AcrR family transcriptional regulator [Agromyces intestinalis]QEO15211.1 TetR/AcrR family transcriptional regulator [Agromyces intestinalis]
MAYHHGRLRETLIDEAVAAIEADGVDRLSLRDLARRAGVSHAAPAHHFGDRTGLFTAIAIDGFDRLTAVLEASGGDFAEAGVAYVRFATAERGRFEVMFRTELLRDDDPALAAARERAGAVLRAGAGAEAGDARANALAAWSLVHGFATLWNSGAIDADGQAPDELARVIAVRLFGSPERVTRASRGGDTPVR